MHRASLSHAAMFAQHIGESATLARCLQKLCDRCDQRGHLGGTIKLGDAALPAEELRRLRDFFGNALKTSGRGEHRLDLAKFLAEVPHPNVWVEQLYAALQRQRRNLPDEAARAKVYYQQQLDRFRLAFPDLAPVYRCLEEPAQCGARGFTRAAASQQTDTWFKLAEVVRFLQNNRTQVGLSDLGARFFSDSKILRSGALKTTLCQWLNALQADTDAVDVNPAELLASYGVTDNPTSVKVCFFGRLRYRKYGKWLQWPCDLCATGESATLSLDNLADIEVAEFIDAPAVITCENETPFNNLRREPIGLPVIYTAGFPNAAVLALLALLRPDIELRHWGDSDRHGLQIACILARSRPLVLWRCGLAELRRQQSDLKPLAATEQSAIRRLLREEPNHPFAAELAFTAEHGWLEQEAWQPETAR